MEEATFSGKLKQQCLDDEGMYEWTEKVFVLFVKKGLLEMYPTSKEESPSPAPLPSQLSLVGAKQAKEWTVASQAMGFGFDLIWSSGNIWSFLADDQMNCQKWVANINESISSSASVLTKSHEDLRPLLFLGKQMIDSLPAPPPPSSSSSTAVIQHLNESDTTINEDFQSPTHLMALGIGENGNEEGGNTVPRFVGETIPPSSVPVVHAGVGIDISTPMVMDNYHRRERIKPSMDAPSSSAPSSSAYRASANLAASHLSSCANVELEALRLRVKQLSDTIDDERSQVDKGRKEVTRLQADLDSTNLGDFPWSEPSIFTPFHSFHNISSFLIHYSPYFHSFHNISSFSSHSISLCKAYRNDAAKGTRRFSGISQ